MRVLLTGGGGMLASAITDQWHQQRPHDDLITLRRRDVDLRDRDETARAFGQHHPDLVIHTAAHVGGIADKLAHPLTYLQENLRIDTSVIDAVVSQDVPQFVYTGSAAAYPAAAPNPIQEGALFSGPLELANEPYGLAKLAGIAAVRYAAQQTGRAYRAIAPSNLYGPADSFDPTRAHLIASTIRKAHEAKVANAPEVEVWGDGAARREFTFAPDVAAWLVEAADDLAAWPVLMNVGAGEDHSIREFYDTAAETVGYTGVLRFDATKPAGVPHRLLDSSLARAHGWAPRTSLRDGTALCYRAFLSHHVNGAAA